MTTATIPQAVGDDAPIYVDWSHMPERQPEYWWARLKERDLGELDDNQRLYAERLIRKLTLLEPDEDLADITNRAICEAISRVPTSREAAKAVAAMRSGEAFCYLAFYGLNGTARYLKVGMTNHPEKRICTLATGNPLDCLWVYTARYRSRPAAYGVEQALLRHLESMKRRGEWIDVGNLDAAGAESLARQLGLVAGKHQPTEFSLLGTEGLPE